jgi:hypothetical protein
MRGFKAVTPLGPSALSLPSGEGRGGVGRVSGLHGDPDAINRRDFCTPLRAAREYPTLSPSPEGRESGRRTFST